MFNIQVDNATFYQNKYSQDTHLVLQPTTNLPINSMTREKWTDLTWTLETLIDFRLRPILIEIKQQDLNKKIIKNKMK